MPLHLQLPADKYAFTITPEMPRGTRDDASFGPRLAALRKARGLTRIQLAETTKTTQR